MNNKKIVFWQNIISPHQSYFLNTLGIDNDVILIVENYMSKQRESQGWTTPKLPNVKIFRIENEECLKKLTKEYRDSKHIFSGFPNNKYSLLKKAFIELTKYNKVSLISECPILLGKNIFFKKIKYKLNYLKYKNNINYIFAMGNLGADFFVKLGFNSNNIIPFQYFIEKKDIKEKDIKEKDIKEKDTKCVNFIFVGQLIKRKGIDILLNSLLEMDSDNWKLDIIGDGNLLIRLNEIILNKKLNNITFHGNLKNEDVIKKIEEADYLILPSRFDGWGAVVSEALSVGTKVICSNKCGSSILVNDNNGYVFDINEKESLFKILKKCINIASNSNREIIINNFNEITKNQIEKFSKIVFKI